MKNIGYIIIGISLLIQFPCFAQDNEIIQMSNIVPLEGYTADLLLHNANSYFSVDTYSKKKKKKSSSEVIVDSENNQVQTEKEIVVYSGNIAKHPIGHLTYRYVVDVKENKYRYSFKDMVYIPYERNRYGKFVAVSGKKYSIESIIGNPKFRYRKDIINYVQNYTFEESQRLHMKMIEVEHAENAEIAEDLEW